MEMKPIPLHPAQHDVYTEQLIHATSPLYNIGGFIRLTGSLNTIFFDKAVQQAAKYFDSFSLRYQLNADQFNGYIAQPVPTANLLHQLDFSNHALPEEAATRWMQNDFNQAFAINTSTPLFCYALLKISGNEYWFYGKYHHLVTDGYGFIVWLRYLADCYRHHLNGDVLIATVGSYTEQVQKANLLYQDQHFKSDTNYWLQKFPSFPEALFHKKVQTNHIYPYVSEMLQVEVSARQQQILQQAGLATKAGMLELTIAAVLIYVGNSLDRTGVAIGIPIHKRSGRVLKNIVGMFSGILPFTAAYNRTQTVAQLLAYLRATLKEDFKHQQFILGDVVRSLHAQEAADRLFDVIVNYEPFHFDLQFGPGVQTAVYQLSPNVSRSVLQITWQEHGEKQPMLLQLDYATNYLNRQEAGYIADSLFYIFEQLTNVDRLVGEVSVIAAKEQSLLDSFNPPAVPNTFQNIVQQFQQQAAATPASTSLLVNNQVFTFQQLNLRSNQIAHLLLAQGVTTETLVPVCIERGMEMVAAILAILKTGAAYVPMDPSYPPQRIAYMLNDTKARLVVSSTSAKKCLPPHAKLQIIEVDLLPPSDVFTDITVSIRPNQLAYIIYTSGSTGQPKGVMIEHHNVSAFIDWCRQEFDKSKFDVAYASTSICFDLSVFELFYPLGIGKCIRIVENGILARQFLGVDKNVLLNTVPVVVDSLLKENVDLKNISVLNMAGEPVPTHVLQQLDTDRIEVRNLYGPSEDTTYSSVYRMYRDKPILIGKPLPGTGLHVLNDQHRQIPLCFPGKISLDGAGLARGYLNKPELTAQKFIRHPFAKHLSHRLYLTGDLGRWQTDGNMEYLGRRDNQVKIRGHRIELDEIEHTLLQSGMVQRVVVMVHASETGQKFLAGYFIAKDEVVVNELNNVLRLTLPSYMLPSAWLQLTALPLTPNGKIDRKALPVPRFTTNGTKEVKPAANEMEAGLVNIWKEVLQLNNIGVDDHFFEMGGHSIAALQVALRVQRTFHLKADFGLLVSHPTIKTFARALQNLQSTRHIPLQPVALQPYYELSHAQLRTWVLCKLPGGSLSFNSPAAFSIKGKVSASLLQTALTTLVKRHESLRTSFVEIEGKPYQVIVPANDCHVIIAIEDILLATDAGERIKALTDKETTAPFNLEKAPLLRATLIKKDKGDFLLLFNIHHIVGDGWSKGILVNEFVAILEALMKSDKVQKEGPLLQYKDYAGWQQQVINLQQPYWQKMLSGPLPVASFPLDAPRPRVTGFSGYTLQATISSTTTGLLSTLATENNLTVNHLLFSLYGLLVAHYSNQSKVVIGSLASGRSHIDLENMVGLFINFLPVCLEIKKEAPLTNWLKNMSGVLIGAYDNQDYPFNLMVEKYLTERDFSRNPFFDTMLNFHSEDRLQNTYHVEGLDGKVEIAPLPLFKGNNFQSNLDFKLDVEKVEDEWLLNLTYNDQLFTREKMELFLNRYTEMLQQVAADASLLVSSYTPWQATAGDVDHVAISATVNKEKNFPVLICASFVAEPLKEYLEYWSEEYGLDLAVNFAPYNQVFQQLLNPTSEFNLNEGINILLINIADWLRDKQHLADSEAIFFLNETFEQLLQALSFSGSVQHVPVLAAVVLNGNGQINDAVNSHINHLSGQLTDNLAKQPQFNIINLANVAELYPVEAVFDVASDQMGHIPFTQEFFAGLGTYLARKIRSYKGKIFKVLALDCDNTLWKGICGEAGREGVVINEHFKTWQQFLLKKYNEGFLLVLCSKNNEADVWEVFDKHPEMVLAKEHVAAHRINWNNKPDNVQALAHELNVGVDSFIFIDDSAFEIEQMQGAQPGVCCLQLPTDDNDLNDFAKHTWEFDVYKTTGEDALRNSLYRTEKARKTEEEKHTSYNEFLQSLQIKVTCRNLQESDIDRALQLSIRTNQFNMNGVRPLPNDIISYMTTQQKLGWMVDVEDRFGDYGTVGLLLGNHNNQTLQLETFLLSCRVLGRGVEGLIWEKLKQYSIDHSIKKIAARFVPTEKNKPFESFLQDVDLHFNNETATWQTQVKYFIEEIGT